MKLLKEYISLLVEKEEKEEYAEVSSTNTKEFTYKELYDFLKFLSGKRTARNLIGFGAKIMGGSVIEGILGNIAKEVGEKISSIIDNEITAETLETTLFKKLGLPKDISPAKAIAKFYGVNDKEGLKGIAVPNNVSNLIDDNVEAAFIKNLIKELEVKAKSNPEEKVNSDFVMEKLKEFTLNYNKTKGAFTANK